jgi:hypothetical protein
VFFYRFLLLLKACLLLCVIQFFSLRFFWFKLVFNEAVLFVFLFKIFLFCITLTIFYHLCLYRSLFRAFNDWAIPLHKWFHLRIHKLLFHDVYYFSISLCKWLHKHTYKFQILAFYLHASFLRNSKLQDYLNSFQVSWVLLPHVSF